MSSPVSSPFLRSPLEVKKEKGSGERSPPEEVDGRAPDAPLVRQGDRRVVPLPDQHGVRDDIRDEALPSLDQPQVDLGGADRPGQKQRSRADGKFNPISCETPTHRV
jgi:hypothetical protein